MWWDIKQQTILSINLHVLICALNYAPVDISALFLSYSAGWSHCLLLDLLWQFQKWTPFGVQHRHSPKKKAMGVKRHSVKARIYRATLIAILLATFFGQWLQTAAFRDICRLGGNQAYDGWNIFSGLWVYINVTIHSPQGFSVIIYNTGWRTFASLLTAHWVYQYM